MEIFLMLLIGFVKVVLPFIFGYLAFFVHSLASDCSAESRTKGVLLWTLSILFGAIAIYLFFFSGGFDGFFFDPNKPQEPYSQFGA